MPAGFQRLPELEFNQHKGELLNVFFRFSSTRLPFVLAGVLYCASAAFGQPGQSRSAAGTITVSVDGLACGAPTRGAFEASAFHIEIDTNPGSGGAGAAKAILSNLQILKPYDGCSIPLFLLAANGQLIKQVVLTETANDHVPILSITLEGVRILTSAVTNSGAPENMQEMLVLSYTALTMTDDSGHTTGRIVRDAGSTPAVNL